jgi:S-adenosylmethionine decarboxylase
MHIIVDVGECPAPWKLDNERIVVDSLLSGAKACGATILNYQSHKFTPQGVTAVVMLAESHISVHTWPESGSYALDVYTCGEMDCAFAVERIMWSLGGTATKRHTIQRTL